MKSLQIIIALLLLVNPEISLGQEGEIDFNEGLEPTKISLPASQGSVLGLSGKSQILGNLGSTSYQYAIPMPKWRKILPSLSLTYSSNQGNGIVGQGFNFPIPYIAKTLRYGNLSEETPFESSIDGILVETELGKFRSKNERNFNLYEEIGSSFQMQNGQGTLYTFGQSEQSRESREDFTFKYLLSEVKDSSGNRAVYHYSQESGRSYLEKIELINQDNSKSYIVAVQYEARPDSIESYRNGILQITSKRIESISVYWDNEEIEQNRIHKIKLSYLSQKRSLLGKISRYGKTDTDVAPDVSFDYSSLSDFSDQSANIQEVGAIDSNASIFPRLKSGMFKIIDFNGDGLPDILSRTRSTFDSWHVWYNLGAGKKFKSVILPEESQHFDLTSASFALADLDGDLKIDLLTRSYVTRKISVRLNTRMESNTNQFFWTADKTPIVGIDGAFSLSDSNLGSWVDLNGDSRSEYVYKPGVRPLIFENKGLVDGNFTYESTRQTRILGTPNRWADLNGDSLPDLYGFFSSAEKFVFYYPNNGRGWVDDSNYIKIPYSGNCTGQKYIADLNGDSIVELICFTHGVITIKEQVQGKFEDIKIYTNATSADSSISLRGITSLNFGDINGNGSKDIILTHHGSSDLHFIDYYLDQDVKTPYLMTAYSTSIGEKVEFSYDSSLKNYESLGSHIGVPMTFQVGTLRKQTAFSTNDDSSGIGAKVTGIKELSYQGAVFDVFENSFLGFKNVEEKIYSSTDLTGGLQIDTEYYTDEIGGILHGKPKERVTKSLGEDPFVFSRSVSNWNAKELFDGLDTWYPFLESLEKTNYFRDGTQASSKSEFCTKFFVDQKVPSETTETNLDENGQPYRSTISNYFSNDSGIWVSQVLKSKTLVEHKNDESKPVLGRKYIYDDNTVRLLEVLNGVEGSWKSQTKYKYDSFGNVNTVIDGLGNKTNIFYDSDGAFLPSKITKSLPSTGITLKTEYKYDFGRGGVVSAHTDENGVVSNYFWDGLGRVKSVFRQGDAEPMQSYEYTEGNMRSVSVKTKGISQPTTVYYDSLSRKIGTLVPSIEGTILSHFKIYDMLGRTKHTASSVASGNMNSGVSKEKLTSYYYDDAGRLVLQTLPVSQTQTDTYSTSLFPHGGSVTKGQISLSYSAKHQITYDEEGVPKVNHLDHFGRVCATDRWIGESLGSRSDLNRGCGSVGFEVNVFDQKIGRVELTYDVANHIESIKQTGLASRHYSYDTHGRKTSFASSALGRIEWDHNAIGQIETERTIAQDGSPLSTLFYKYDELGREVERRSLAHVAGNFDQHFQGSSVDYHYTYDFNETSNSNATNLMGRVAKLNLFAGATYSYEYDQYGNVSLENLDLFNKKISTKFLYSDSNQLTKIIYPDDSEIGYDYDRRSGVLIGLQGALEGKLQYDSLLRLKGISIKEATPTAALMSQGFSYDPISENLINQTASVNGVSYLNYDFLAYDASGRLTSYQGKDKILSSIEKNFTYDQSGQLNSAAISLSPVSGAAVELNADYRYNTAGDLIHSRGLDHKYNRNGDGSIKDITVGDKKFSFGKFGRMSKNSDLQEIKYSAAGTVSCLTKTDGDSIRYHYLPNNRRFTEVAKKGNETKSTAYVSKFVSYHKESDTFDFYYYSGRQKIAIRRSGKMTYLIADSLNSSKMGVESDGSISFYEEFGPYGKSLFSHVEKDVKFGFTGAVRDRGFEMLQMQNRYYSAELGRFVSPDPLFIRNEELCISDSISCNLNSYAKNSPLLYTDPSGLNPLTEQYIEAEISNMAYYVKHQVLSAVYAMSGSAKTVGGYKFTGGGVVGSVKFGLPRLKAGLSLRTGYNQGLTLKMGHSAIIGTKGGEFNLGLSKSQPFYSVGISRSRGIATATTYSGGNAPGGSSFSGKVSLDFGFIKLDTFQNGEARIDFTLKKDVGGLDAKGGFYLNLSPTGGEKDMIESADRDFESARNHDAESLRRPYNNGLGF